MRPLLISVLLFFSLLPNAKAKGVDQALDMTVVVTGDGSGTGTGAGVILSGHSVVTSAHLVMGRDKVLVRFRNGPIRRGVVAWRDEPNDLAGIQVDVPERYPRADVSCVDPQVGDEIIAIGHPVTIRWGMTKGYVAGFDFKRRHIIGDLTISKGNSGGPVLDGDGRLVGIARGFLRDAGGLSLIVPASILCEKVIYEEPTSVPVKTSAEFAPVKTSAEFAPVKTSAEQFPAPPPMEWSLAAGLLFEEFILPPQRPVTMIHYYDSLDNPSR